MSTLTIPSQRSTESDVDTRFAVLVHSAPAPHAGQPHVDFETVFDLDYGQPAEVRPVRSRSGPLALVVERLVHDSIVFGRATGHHRGRP